VKFSGSVVSADGTPLASGEVEIVSVEGTSVVSLARGAITKGALEVTAEPGPIWGLLIDKKPILAFPVAASTKDDAADLGQITLYPDGVTAKAFHAPDGKVFGLPAITLPTTKGTQPPPVPPTAAPALKTGLTFSGLVGSTAQQLSAIGAVKSGFSLTGASVRVRGVPTTVEDVLGLDFPNADLAASGVGLSELAFTLKPPTDTTPTDTPPSGPTAPDLVGYGQELATRKLAALGLFTDVSSVIVQDPAQVGRVVRQLPAAHASVSPGSMVRLFVGKRPGA
jgi:hypothetical protein